MNNRTIITTLHTSSPFDARPTITLMAGLPGSGKSSYAKKILNNTNTFRINKDDIREMMTNGVNQWSRPLEASVVAASRALGERALEQGFSVVIDDTGFSKYHNEHWEKLGKRMNYNVKHIFVDTDVEVCKQRCDERGGPVTRQVVKDMYTKYEDVIKELRNGKNT